MSLRLTRRHALRIFAGTALAAAPVVWSGRNALAGRGWCYAEPVFLVGDWVVDVTLGSDVAMLLAASGPIDLVLTVPAGVSASLLAADAGFGHGYAIDIQASPGLPGSAAGTRLAVEARAPATDSSLPVTVTVTILVPDDDAMRATAEGIANRWITVRDL